jgi:hypothetical protein
MGQFCLVQSVIMVFALSFPVHGAVVINELFPDPEGADSGKEFVELFNAGSTSINLAGLQLQFGNGSEEAHWVVRWNCEQEIFLDPGQYFLIADRNWQGGSDPGVEVYLGLQNGPDSIRIVQGLSVLDMVGYGPLTDGQMMEGSAASIVSGQTLARRPDGWDTDNNELDFVSTDPTPGTNNFLPYDLRLVDLLMDPPSAQSPDEFVSFHLLLKNNGTEVLPVVQVVLQVGAEQISGVLDGNSPGQQRSLLFRGIPGAIGKLPLALLVPVQDHQELLSIDLGYYQVGPGSLVINEILGSPDQGQGEWVEFLVTENGGSNLDQYRIREEGGDWLMLPGCPLEKGDLIVVAQDSLGLVFWMDNILNQGYFPGCGISGSPLGWTIFYQRSWPTLNNSAPEGRDFADRLYLCDSDGCIIDHVTLGWEIPGLVQDMPDGHSLERVGLSAGTTESSIWAPSLAQSGSTPGCTNSVNMIEVVRSSLNLSPQLLDPAQGVSSLNIGFEVTSPGVGWDLRLFDLWGNLVRDLGSEMHGAGPRQLLWDGRDDAGGQLPSGAYVVLLRIKNSAGSIVVREKKLAVLRWSDQ